MEWLCEGVLGVLTAAAGGAMLEAQTPPSAMSEEQLASLLAKLKDDAGLQEKLKGAADLDAAVALAKEAGFAVDKADWLKHQAQQALELSDEELENVAGGEVDAFCRCLGTGNWSGNLR
jgi:predicted ribosomally synthesized peptide with nif11-like leader